VGYITTGPYESLKCYLIQLKNIYLLVPIDMDSIKKTDEVNVDPKLFG